MIYVDNGNGYSSLVREYPKFSEMYCGLIKNYGIVQCVNGDLWRVENPEDFVQIFNLRVLIGKTKSGKKYIYEVC